jgi:hypothetical protein
VEVSNFLNFTHKCGWMKNKIILKRGE